MGMRSEFSGGFFTHLASCMRYFSSPNCWHKVRITLLSHSLMYHSDLSQLEVNRGQTIKNMSTYFWPYFLMSYRCWKFKKVTLWINLKCLRRKDFHFHLSRLIFMCSLCSSISRLSVVDQYSCSHAAGIHWGFSDWEEENETPLRQLTENKAAGRVRWRYRWRRGFSQNRVTL